MLTMVTTPDWLAQHDGELRPSKDNVSFSVSIGGQLRYVLAPVPAKGKHACRVTDTVNGRRLDAQGTYATPEDAVRGGLDDLRRALGW